MAPTRHRVHAAITKTHHKEYAVMLVYGNKTTPIGVLKSKEEASKYCRDLNRLITTHRHIWKEGEEEIYYGLQDFIRSG